MNKREGKVAFQMDKLMSLKHQLDRLKEQVSEQMTSITRGTVYFSNFNVFWCWHPDIPYDKKSAEGSKRVRQGDESDCGKIVLKQVKWTYFDAYIYDKQNAKSTEGSKVSDSVFLQWDVSYLYNLFSFQLLR